MYDDDDVWAKKNVSQNFNSYFSAEEPWQQILQVMGLIEGMLKRRGFEKGHACIYAEGGNKIG